MSEMDPTDTSTWPPQKWVENLCASNGIEIHAEDGSVYEIFGRKVDEGNNE